MRLKFYINQYFLVSVISLLSLGKYSTLSFTNAKYWLHIINCDKYWLHIILIISRLFGHLLQLTLDVLLNFIISFNVPVTIIKSIFCRLLISVRHYTGDYSHEEDCHPCAAEILQFSPDICIIESTYGVQLHQPRNVREKRFTDVIHSTISQGGCVLIPAFALGRTQELLLILDEYWSNHPELHNIPISPRGLLLLTLVPLVY